MSGENNFTSLVFLVGIIFVGLFVLAHIAERWIDPPKSGSSSDSSGGDACRGQQRRQPNESARPAYKTAHREQKKTESTTGDGDLKNRRIAQLEKMLEETREKNERLKVSGRIIIAQRDLAQSKCADLEYQIINLGNKYANISSGSDGAKGDIRFREVKNSFARLYHPDRLSGAGFDRTIREEVFKEFWSEIERIEKG